MESNRKPSGMSKLRKGALTYLIVGMCAIGLGCFATVRTPRHPHTIWPVHSHYLLPHLLVLWGYFALGLAALFIVLWLVGGDETDGE